MKPCSKTRYATPAKAKKALKKYGYTIGCKRVYKCPLHGADVVYHLTSQCRS